MTLAAQMLADVGEVFLNTEDFAESVTFRCDSGPVETTALVVLDEPIRDEQNKTAAIYTGTLEISTAASERIQRDRHVALTVTVRNLAWNVTSCGPPELGLVSVGIQRQETIASNAVGLDGKGIRYARKTTHP